MKLYHGTGAHLLNSILTDGLVPRGDRAGNWKKYPSHAEMVYLTAAYALYFAVHHHRETALIVEVNTERLDPERLYPDEDFLSQTKAGADSTRIARVHGATVDNLHRQRRKWRASLGGIGNCAYRRPW